MYLEERLNRLRKIFGYIERQDLIVGTMWLNYADVFPLFEYTGFERTSDYFKQLDINCRPGIAGILEGLMWGAEIRSSDEISILGRAIIVPDGITVSEIDIVASVKF